MCFLNCRAGGRSEGRTTNSRTFLLCSDRWMQPLPIHLALVKHSQRQIREGGSTLVLEPASNLLQSCLLPYSFLLLFPWLSSFHFTTYLHYRENKWGSILVEDVICFLHNKSQRKSLKSAVYIEMFKI